MSKPFGGGFMYRQLKDKLVIGALVVGIGVAGIGLYTFRKPLIQKCEQVLGIEDEVYNHETYTVTPFLERRTHNTSPVITSCTVERTITYEPSFPSFICDGILSKTYELNYINDQHETATLLLRGEFTGKLKDLYDPSRKHPQGTSKNKLSRREHLQLTSEDYSPLTISLQGLDMDVTLCPKKKKYIDHNASDAMTSQERGFKLYEHSVKVMGHLDSLIEDIDSSKSHPQTLLEYLSFVEHFEP